MDGITELAKLLKERENADGYSPMFGTVGNIPQGSINRFPVTLSGIVSVANSEPATGGFNEETDNELRDRYFEKVSLQATSGSKYHYIQWAKEVNGVWDAKCLPLWNGNGTVKVIVINSEKGVASKELIAEVKKSRGRCRACFGQFGKP